MSECACGHSRIKRITWNENMGQSEKIMCLDCNTDFVPLTPFIRDAIRNAENVRDEIKTAVTNSPDIQTHLIGDKPKARDEAIAYPPPILGRDGFYHRADGVFVELPYDRKDD